MSSKTHKVHNDSGQAITEYIVMIAVIVSMYLIVARGLSNIAIGQRLLAWMMGPYAAAYQFGHPKAKGPDSPSGAENHPRAEDGGSNNFRIFLNPER